MIAVWILIGVVIIMACNQTQTIGSVIHDDPEIPVPPRNGEGGGGVGVAPQITGSGVMTIGDANPPAYDDPANNPTVDPHNPIEPPGELGPPVEDPINVWQLPPVALPPAPELPLKVDPVAYVEPVYYDPEIPVPTTAEKTANTNDANPPIGSDLGPPVANIDQPSDFYLPLPTQDSDPAQYSAPADLSLLPPENPIDNWTAESAADTECPPSVEIEYAAGAMQ